MFLLLVAFSPDGMSIVTAWTDGKLRAYLPQSGTLIYEVPHAHHLDATAVVITECNRYGKFVLSENKTTIFKENNFWWC